MNQRDRFEVRMAESNEGDLAWVDFHEAGGSEVRLVSLSEKKTNLPLGEA